MNTRPEYTHMIVECHKCSSELVDDPSTVRDAIRLAAKSCRLIIIEEAIHRFRPQGVTGFALLKESHISVHTWPESRFALVDIVSCTVIDTEAFVACFEEMFKPGYICI